MTTKKLLTLAVSVFSLTLTATTADAKFISTGEKFQSKVISEEDYANSGKTIKDYKGCSATPLKAESADVADDYDSAVAKDPLEGFNRPIFKFNHALDTAILKPVAKGYRYITPQWGRDRVSSIFNNLDEPRNFVNSILQLNGKGALTSFWRFTINSTFGILGMHDVAAGFGLRDIDRDFSTSLAYYGVETGPYLEIPFFGPSTIRDAFSKIPDAFTYPTNYIEDEWVSVGVNIIDTIQSREAILDYTNDLERDSFDLYSSYRSSYLQNRKKNVQRALSH